MCAKKFSSLFCLIFLLGELAIFSLFVLLYLYDPFQFFHQPIQRDNTFIADMRITAAGIIDHYDFDSVIIGSSMLENTSIAEAKQKLGGEWVNLSFGVARFNERDLLLNYIFKRKKIKQVIYSLDSYHLVNAKHQAMIMNKNIYSEYPLVRFIARFKYYLSTHFMRCALFWKTDESCVGLRNLENVTSWYALRAKAFEGFEYWWDDRKEGALEGLNILKNSTPPPPENDELIQIQQYIQNFLFPIIQNHPQIRFHLIIPPFSRAFYKIPTEALYHDGRNGQQYYQDFKLMLTWVLNEIAHLPNVRFYGFDDLDYPNHLNHYCDGNHYNTDMNSLFLSAIQKNQHRLTLENASLYFLKLENEIKNYNIQPFINAIEHYEKQKKLNHSP